MQVFICGIIQGSLKGKDIHEQMYRKRIRDIIQKYLPAANVYCPVSLHPKSPFYVDERAFKVLNESIEAARVSDLLIAYLPEASMGSAIEMWEAKQAGVKIIAITSMTSNWVVRYVSDVILKDIDEFEDFARKASLAKLVQKT